MTVGFKRRISVLELREALVLLESASEGLSAVGTNVVVVETVYKHANGVSRGANTRAESWVGGGVLERLEGCVHFESISKVLSSNGTEVVAIKTANKSKNAKRQRVLTVLVWSGASRQAYLSVFVTVFDVTRLAMMTTEATRRPLCERSMDSMTSSPFSCLIGRGCPSTLPVQNTQNRRHRVANTRVMGRRWRNRGSGKRVLTIACCAWVCGAP